MEPWVGLRRELGRDILVFLLPGNSFPPPTRHTTRLFSLLVFSLGTLRGRRQREESRVTLGVAGGPAGTQEPLNR
jgi:hypothetical protein